MDKNAHMKVLRNYDNIWNFASGNSRISPWIYITYQTSDIIVFFSI